MLNTCQLILYDGGMALMYKIQKFYTKRICLVVIEKWNTELDHPVRDIDIQLLYQTFLVVRPVIIARQLQPQFLVSVMQKVTGSVSQLSCLFSWWGFIKLFLNYLYDCCFRANSEIILRHFKGHLPQDGSHISSVKTSYRAIMLHLPEQCTSGKTPKLRVDCTQ